MLSTTIFKMRKENQMVVRKLVELPKKGERYGKEKRSAEILWYKCEETMKNQKTQKKEITWICILKQNCFNISLFSNETRFSWKLTDQGLFQFSNNTVKNRDAPIPHYLKPSTSTSTYLLALADTEYRYEYWSRSLQFLQLNTFIFNPNITALCAF